MITTPCDLSEISPEGDKVLRYLLGHWLRNSPEGRGLLAEMAEAEVIEALLGLRARGLARFTVTGDIDEGPFTFAVELDPALAAPLLAAVPPEGRA